MVLGIPLAAMAADAADYWGQWRGPLASGVAPKAHPPVEWSEQKNVRWKYRLTGEGAGTPVVWGDLVIVQAAVKDAAPGDPGKAPPARGAGKPYRFVVTAVDRRTGKPAWERTVAQAIPHEPHHADGTYASPSPMTDGEHIFAYFGSQGIYCLTMGGELVWKRDLGDMKTRNQFGEGSSPTLYGDLVIVNWDNEENSFIVALDKKTGEDRWRQARDESTSWSTPLVIPDARPVQVVVSATKRVRSYDAASGKLVWECAGLGIGCVTSPVADAGMVFAMSGHRDPALLAIRHEGATGDISTSKAVTWRLQEGTPYVPSPLLYGGLLYFAQKNEAILSCHDAKTGKAHFSRERLEALKGLYASPVGADGRVYVTGRNGVTCVLRQGPKLEIIATNRLDDRFTASAAVAGNELYLRGYGALYCIAAD
jgi:outer membrane protein assembly factor BamB